jgi:capsular exopolysaccharide synthesis family protein
MTPNRDQPFSLGMALVVLRRRLPVLLICLIGVPAAALGISLLQEKQYTAEASLLFRDPALDQKLFGSTFLEPSGDPDREAATNIKLVSLDAVATRTARVIPGSLSPDAISDKVEVAAEGQSDVASVKATDPDARFAARLANTFAEQYILFRREADRSKVREAQQLVQRQLESLSPAEMQGPRGRSIRERSEQLQILASLQTGNAELVQRAEVPESPSSPDTARNVALGIVLGLMLGVGLAFLLERLDRRIRDPKEFEELFDRPLLASIPESRALARGGPAQLESLPPVEQEAFRMLRANLRYFSVDRPVKSVLVTSAAPGDGKSTVAWNLGLAAAGTGARVLVLETDLRRPSLAASAESVVPAPGLSTVLAGQIEFSEAVQAVVVPSHQGSPTTDRTMDVMVAGPIPPNPVDLIESERMRKMLQEAEERYDLLVLDTPPTSVVSDAIPLIREVSGVIVVTRLGRSTRESVAQLRKQLENLDAPTLGIVVNAFKADRGIYGYGYGYGYGDKPSEQVSEPAPASGGNGAQAAGTPGRHQRFGR